MDRQGWERGEGAYGTTSGAGKPMGQKIKERIPGTEEHRIHQAEKVHTGEGVGAGLGTSALGTNYEGTTPMTTTDTAYGTSAERTGYGTGDTTIGTAGHGVTGGSGYDMSSGYGTTATTTTDSGYGTVTGAGRDVPLTDTAKVYIPGMVVTEGTTGTTTDASRTTGTSGVGTYDDHVRDETEHKSRGEKIKEKIPGTQEHKERKIEQGRY